jgi:excisionase family DNA binding protein
MTSTLKQRAPRSRASVQARNVSSATGRSASAEPVLRLSFSFEPLVSIIQRHVKVSEKARQAIARDLASALGQADVQLLAAMESAPGLPRPEEQSSDPVLTTEQAARLIGVSRPFMVRLIDSGAVALHQKVGNQRRVLRSAVLGWQQIERERQAKSLKRLAKDLDEEIFPS